MNTNDVFKFFKKNLKTEDDMLNMSATLLGCAVIQSQHIIESANFIEVPDKVNYAMALIMGNYMIIFHESKIGFSKLDLSDKELPDRDKAIEILKHLIEVYKEDLK